MKASLKWGKGKKHYLAPTQRPQWKREESLMMPRFFHTHPHPILGTYVENRLIRTIKVVLREERSLKDFSPIGLTVKEWLTIY